MLARRGFQEPAARGRIERARDILQRRAGDRAEERWVEIGAQCRNEPEEPGRNRVERP